MTPKWTIRKYPIRGDGRPANSPWFVFPPGVIPPVTHCNALNVGFDIFHTFPQALACVEYQTRKDCAVKVVLPRVYRSGAINHEDLGHDQGVMINSGDTDVVIRTVTGDATIHDKNLKHLALHLLALHYEKENQ